ncbi:hypothetical protein ANN_24515, partial [Periplaneta americana]
LYSVNPDIFQHDELIHFKSHERSDNSASVNEEPEMDCNESEPSAIIPQNDDLQKMPQQIKPVLEVLQSGTKRKLYECDTDSDVDNIDLTLNDESTASFPDLHEEIFLSANDRFQELSSDDVNEGDFVLIKQRENLMANRKANTTIQSEAREILANIIEKCDEERVQKHFRIPLNKSTERVAEYTGVGYSTIKKIRKEHKIRKENSLDRLLKSPGKKRRIMSRNMLHVDDFNKCVIDRISINFNNDSESDAEGSDIENGSSSSEESICIPLQKQVKNVFREGRQYTAKVQQQFLEQFPNSKLTYRDTIYHLINKFRETGSVQDAARSGSPHPPVLTEDKLLDISDRMLKSPTKSLRKLAQQTNILYTSAHKAVKQELNLYPYK